MARRIGVVYLLRLVKEDPTERKLGPAGEGLRDLPVCVHDVGCRLFFHRIRQTVDRRKLYPLRHDRGGAAIPQNYGSYSTRRSCAGGIQGAVGETTNTPWPGEQFKAGHAVLIFFNSRRQSFRKLSTVTRSPALAWSTPNCR